ncbi:MAG TPA: hypothetical protein VF389_07795 [Woeseiaceae bacterium]
MKRHLGMLAILSCLAFTQLPEGMAHGVNHSAPHFVGQRIVVVHDIHAAERFRGTRPRWLQTHGYFNDWYLKSRYRHASQLSWLQLYDLYGIELRHARPVRHVKMRSARHDRYRYAPDYDRRKNDWKKRDRKKHDRYKRNRDR